jgi:hypothetical protein
LTELLEKEKIKIIDINDIILSTIKYEQYRLSNFPEKIRKYMIRSCFNVKIMDSIFTNLYKNFKNIIKEISEDRINNMCSVKITVEEEKRIIINNTETDSSLQYILLQTKSYSRPTCHLMLLQLL